MFDTIREVMHRGVVTCRVSTCLDEVARILLDNDVSALVVTDEHLDACGLITKTDLIKSYGKDLASITAEDVMVSELITISPDAPVREAIQRMLDRKVHQLVIVSDAPAHHRPVGIFTDWDAVAVMAGRSDSSSPQPKKSDPGGSGS